MKRSRLWKYLFSTRQNNEDSLSDVNEKESNSSDDEESDNDEKESVDNSQEEVSNIIIKCVFKGRVLCFY